MKATDPGRIKAGQGKILAAVDEADSLKSVAGKRDDQRLRFFKTVCKRNRQTERRNERNRAIRSEMRTRAKLAITAAEAGDSDKANEALMQAQKRFDMAVTKGVIHKNTAARRKARLTAQVRSLLAA